MNDDDDDDDHNNNNNNNNSVFLNNLNNLNNEISNVKSDGEYYARLIGYQNETIEKLEKEITDRKKLTKDMTSKTINENKKERLEYCNKYKNTLFGYINTLEQLNNAENTYGREIGNLNNTINDERIRTNELRNTIQHLEDIEEEYLGIIDELNNKLDELKNRRKFLKNDNKILKESIHLIERKNNYLIKEYIEIQVKVKKDEVKIRDMLSKFNDNMKNNMNNLYKEFKYKKMSLMLN